MRIFPRKDCNDMILFETKVEIYFSLRLVHLAKTENYTFSGIVLNETFETMQSFTLPAGKLYIWSEIKHFN